MISELSIICLYFLYFMALHADNPKNNTIILASSSERRISILNKLGLNFISVKHKIDTEPAYSKNSGISIENFIMMLATDKARSIENRYPNSFIIGADTLIYLDGKVYGKPLDFFEAKRIIKHLSGKTHEVYTGISLINRKKNIYEADIDKSLVKIKYLTDAEIIEYINKYPPYDKAGSYGVQDENGIVENFTGSFNNILGLCTDKLIPLLNKYELLKI